MGVQRMKPVGSGSNGREAEMMHAALQVSMVICAYTEERWEDLETAVRAARDVLRPGDELVVVIDHNDSLMRRATAAFAVEGDIVTTVAPNAGKRGLSGARNTGVGICSKPIVAFIDDDAAVHRGWREVLVSHYDDPNVAGVGGYAEPVWPGSRPVWLPLECDWVVGCSYSGLPGSVTDVRNVMGCNMSFRRELLLRSGGFNTDIGRVGKHPVGCEETEFCIRLVQRWPSKRILFDPDLRVSHHVSEDRVRLGYLTRRCFGEGISKRQISRMIGSADATSTERAYLLRTVPAAMVRGIREGVSPQGRCDSPGGIARSGVLGLSVAAAAAGYVYASAQGRWRDAESTSRGFAGVASA
jgi:glycosyltransferase involved in cell wall biosynthesis